jgi:hypothetical protein
MSGSCTNLRKIISIDGAKSNLLYGDRTDDGETGSRMKTKSDSKASQEIVRILEQDSKHILIAEHLWELRGKFY